MNAAAPAPWDDLRLFLAVAQHGAIAKAAGYLGVNHSTVLRRIAALENALGTRLFERLRDGYVLTTAGNDLAHRLRGLQEQVDAAQRQALGVDEEIQGAIRLLSSDVIVESLLMPALARFRALHPGVRIELLSGQALLAPANDDIDIAVLAAEPAPPRIGRRIGEIETVPCAARGYLDSNADLKAWREHRWIVLEDGLLPEAMARWLEKQVPPSQILARVDSLVGIADAVAAGLGIGFVPRPLARGRRDLVELAPPEAGMRIPVQVSMHPEVKHVARMRALFDFLSQDFVGSGALAKKRR